MRTDGRCASWADASSAARDLPCHSHVSGWALTAPSRWEGRTTSRHLDQADMRTAQPAVLLELEFWAPVAEALTYDVSSGVASAVVIN
jgi:hypothetical protein